MYNFILLFFGMGILVSFIVIGFQMIFAMPPVLGVLAGIAFAMVLLTILMFVVNSIFDE